MVVVDSEITIRNCPRSIRDWCDSELVLTNPAYYRLRAMGKWTGSTPESFVLYRTDGDDVIVPFGMLLPLWRRFRATLGGVVDNRIHAARTRSYGSKINLYDYQEAAVRDALAKRQGVLVAPCGSGKTQMGLELAARLGYRTLWLTHTKDLLNQSMERAKAVFDMPLDEYGVITEGKVQVGSTITFATVQTLVRTDLRKLRDCWDVIIVDECHHVAGTPTRVMQFYKVLSNLSARYKYGLTATPKRSDGLTNAMYAMLGPCVHTVSKDDVEGKTCAVTVAFRDTCCGPDYEKVVDTDGTISYTKLITELINDGERNKAILNEALRYPGRCLILTERVAHVKMLAEALRARGLSTGELTGGTSHSAKVMRTEVLNAFRAGSLNFVVATYALAKEGLDIPELETVIFATPQKNDSVVTQSAGRVSRVAEGKLRGLVIDFVDDFPMLTSWAKRRKTIYKRLHYAVAEF